jgi:hypothetical protein
LFPTLARIPSLLFFRSIVRFFSCMYANRKMTYKCIWLCKGKVALLCTMDGTWGKRRYSSYSSLTLAVERGERSASCTSCTLPLGKNLQCPLYRGLGGPQSWSGKRLKEKSSVSVGDWTPVILSILRHYTELPNSNMVMYLSHHIICNLSFNSYLCGLSI